MIEIHRHPGTAPARSRAGKTYGAAWISGDIQTCITWTKEGGPIYVPNDVSDLLRISGELVLGGQNVVENSIFLVVDEAQLILTSGL